MRKFIALIAACAALPMLAHAADLEVRFCPAKQVHAYPLNDARGVQGLLVQNLAVINTARTPAKVSEVQIDLLRGGEVIDSRRLVDADLERAGKAGKAIDGGGLLEAMGFQFCGRAMVPSGITLGGPDLAADQALLVTSQAFAWRGQRDAVRVTATVEPGARKVSAELPIVAGPAPIAFKFPLKGAWYLGAGPSFNTQHRWGVQEEFGFDLLRLGADGRTHSGAGDRFADYHAYGQTVFAAADGKVVSIANAVPEDPKALRQPGETDEVYFQRVVSGQMALLAKGGSAIVGNHVVIDHGGGIFSVSAHLQPGSVTVLPGDLVRQGQPIGKLGSSGNSTEPHLHWQACDGPDPLRCAAIPVQFPDVKAVMADLPAQLQSGDVVVVP